MAQILTIFLKSNIILKNRFFLSLFNFLLHMFLSVICFSIFNLLIDSSSILVSSLPMFASITVFMSFININLKIAREEEIKFSDIFFMNFNILKIYISSFIFLIFETLIFVLVEKFFELKGFFDMFFPILLLLFILIYSQFFYVVVDLNPKGFSQALRYSRELLKGNFVKFIVLEILLQMSNILIFVTFGLLSFWILPLAYLVRTNFYLYLLENTELIELKDEEIIDSIEYEDVDCFDYED